MCTIKESDLTPNRIVPGGVNGISSIMAHFSEMQMGSILFILNLPFVIYGKIVSRTKIAAAESGLLLLGSRPRCDPFMRIHSIVRGHKTARRINAMSST